MDSKTKLYKNDQLLNLRDAAAKAEITYETLRKMINAGYIRKVMIESIPLVYYRELLRGSWEYEQNKKPGGRPRKVTNEL